ncbi:DUF1508 domain-containing protein, partial [Arthrobacter sp. HMWF013]|uniref:DUF1508 domain-containing protein n=1 Tax=Arthrobacter sp. HMWF013 TaxID=2056849 RepID=UPI000D38F07E
MAGKFELFIDAESLYRFRVTAPDGTVMAVSTSFRDKAAAVAGIAAVREYAGMGLISDLTAGREHARAAHRAPRAEPYGIRRLSASE